MNPDDKLQKLTERIKLIKECARILFEEATDFERELGDLYPLANNKKKKAVKYVLSKEDKIRIRIAAYKRRKIQLPPDLKK